ncbi:MAG: aminodeoxychorismate lyase [Bacteroidetes bacterium 4572_112]|nr:MAG: aminodeoxychorismate lyase [Bacteroidetes bacterium 4572_112]
MNKKKLIIFFLIGVIAILAIFAGLFANKLVNKPIVDIGSKNSIVFYIPSGADFSFVHDKLIDDKIISNAKSFDYMADIKSYNDNIKAGRYIIKNGMTAMELVNLLRSGAQTPIRVTFNNIRFLPNFASKVSPKFEFDSIQLMNLLTDEEYLKKIGYNKQTIISLFLPNTYEMWWNTDADKFIQRMKNEHDKFWNDERIAKANKIGLSPLEVSILASIVQEETNKRSEMSRIAGVYINRLNVGMLLQADPTARFAYGDFSVKRVTYDYLKIDSPYNTYKYKGLPPGPICMANPSTIDKVLDYESHKYYYFCAKADNSGTHAFARNLRQHNNNAKAYHRYLNKQRIYR